MNESEKPINETVRDEYIVTDDGEIIRHEEAVEPIGRRINPGLIAALILAIVVVFFIGWYVVGSRTIGAGQPVPAPRSSMNDVPAETLANKALTLSHEQVQN